MKKLYGNAIVGQSGGPTAAINATLCGVVRGVLAQMGEDACIEKLYGMRNGIEGLMDERMICLSDFFDSEEKLKLLEQTPAAALGSCRLKLPKTEDAENNEKYIKLFDFFKKNNIRYFFYIGGNDSMDTVSKLSSVCKYFSWDMNFVGVPKTIDNDLAVTDHTPGYGSAAKFIATVISEMLCDTAVYTVKAVTIVEIMGRDTGWLTAASALASANTGVAPDYIYLPERNFDYDEFFADIEKAFKKHPNVLIAVSEGLHFADGRLVGEGKQSGATDVSVINTSKEQVKRLKVLSRNTSAVRCALLSLTFRRDARHILRQRQISTRASALEARRFAHLFRAKVTV